MRESRKRVNTNSMEGKIEKSSGFTVYMDVINMITDRVILRARDKSSNTGGSGSSMATRMPITNRTIAASAESSRIPPVMLFDLASI